MRVDWKPSPELLQKAKKVHEMKKTMTFDEIAKEIGNHRTYLIALNNYYKKHTGKK